MSGFSEAMMAAMKASSGVMPASSSEPFQNRVVQAVAAPHDPSRGVLGPVR